MSDDTKRRGISALLVDLTPLKVSPAFAKLWISNSVSQIGAMLTAVAVGLHVYALTGSTLAVSLVSVWSLGPMIVAGLVGGTLADAFDRRKVAIVTAVVAWASIGAMTAIAFASVAVTWPYYALAALNAASATIMGTARGAIYPRLLPKRLLPAASALGGITMGVAISVGPALAGVLVAAFGVPWTFLSDALLFTVGFWGLWSLPPIPPIRAEGSEDAGEVRGAAARSPLARLVRAAFVPIGESMRFLRNAPNVRATFIFDIIAMTLGQPRVVFPAAGALVLGGGAVTVGVLTASIAIGGLLASLFSGPLGSVRRQGRAVTIAVAAYGVAILLFGLVLLVAGLTEGIPAFSPLPKNIGDYAIAANLPAIGFACLALGLSGFADQVSSVFRTTILQSATPDDVLGRMQGLFYVVVAGGPRIGDFLAGVVATAVAIWAPALFGGVAIVVLMLVLLRVARGFQRYDGLHPQP